MSLNPNTIRQFYFCCFFTFIHFPLSPLSFSFISSTISFISLLPFSGRWHKMTHKGWHIVKPQHNQSILFLLFLYFHSFSSFSPVFLFHFLYYLFYLSSPLLWETIQNDPQGLMCCLTPTQSISFIFAVSSFSSFSPVLFNFLYYLFYLSSPFLWEMTQNDPQGLTCH